MSPAAICSQSQANSSSRGTALTRRILLVPRAHLSLPPAQEGTWHFWTATPRH